MTLTIELTPLEEAQLRERAAYLGQEPEALAHLLITSGLVTPHGLAELLEPFRRQVDESGLSDSELDSLIEQARDEVYASRQALAG